MRDIPVYLFLGFLEAGKTTFMQGTLEDARFNAGERTLLLLCEDGEVALEPDTFAAGNVFIEALDCVEQINPDKLEALRRKHRAERVVIEYNGMWPTADLMNAFPEGWMLAQCLAFFDGTTFDVYNANMRSLVVDKLQDCELCVFNRLPDDADLMQLHKIVRGVSRRADIVYEYHDGKVVPDEIEDPLPFDIDAPVIEIADADYALFYRDVTEEPRKYIGKTVRTKVQAVTDKRFPDGWCAMGRHIMTCCVEDITYCPLVAKIADGMQIDNTAWYVITAKIDLRFSRMYGKKGPVFLLHNAEKAEPPEQKVATFY